MTNDSKAHNILERVAGVTDELLTEHARQLVLSGIPVMQSTLLTGDMFMLVSPRLYKKVEEARKEQEKDDE